MLKVAFFTEAGTKRGYGHLVRCYTISQEFQHFALDFFVDSDINFDEKMPNLQYFTWETLELTKHYDIIFIDSYIADIEIYTILQKSSQLCVYLDDFARLEYPQGLIINFAPDAQELFFQEKKAGYSYLLGLDYIPIRKEFQESRVEKKEQLFIMLGGSDTANITLKIVDTLQDIALQKIVVHNDLNTVTKLKKYKNVEVLYQPNDRTLIKAMQSSSLAITTASMSSYEFAYLQIPSLLVGLSKNQQDGIKQLLKHNIAFDAVSIEDLHYLEKLRQGLKATKFLLSNKIDAKGTQRIYDKVMELV